MNAPQLVTDSLASLGRRHPDRTALVSDDGALTYGELAAAANHMADALVAMGTGLGHRVGLIGHKAAGSVVALYGILGAGAAYVPLDPAAPAARVAELVRDSGCGLVVSVRPDDPLEIAVRDLTGARVAAPDELAGADRGAGSGSPAAVGPDSVAYCMYTSGSTGRPKGVLIPHRGLISFVGAFGPLLGLGPRDRCLNTGALYHDVSVLDIILPLTRGATVHLGPAVPSPEALVRLIERERITHLYASASVLSLISGYTGGLADCDVSSVRQVVTGVETLIPQVAQDWLAASAGLRIVNAYGPTEATCAVTAHTIDRREHGRTRQYPIGAPVPGVTVRFLADSGEVRTEGPGELLLSGEQLMIGYLDRPEEEARVFLSHGGVRYYRTGDQVHQDADGALVFAGRRDDEVKIMGNRVNLAEVSRVLELHDEIGLAVTAAVPDHRGDQTLNCALAPRAYTQAPAGGSDPVADSPVLEPFPGPAERAILAHAEALLPRPMVPARLLRLPVVPLLASGKPDVDRIRAALRSAVTATQAPEDVMSVTATPEPAGTPDPGVYAGVLDAWSQVLGSEPQADDADFFTEGGHSLAAVRLAAILSRGFDVRLAGRDVLENPTPERLTALVTGLNSPAEAAASGVL